jgi:hypothetical protein
MVALLHRLAWRHALSHLLGHGPGMTTHAFEARRPCVATWRVYADSEDDDPMNTCVACGADTLDLVDIGEPRSAGQDTV